MRIRTLLGYCLSGALGLMAGACSNADNVAIADARPQLPSDVDARVVVDIDAPPVGASKDASGADALPGAADAALIDGAPPSPGGHLLLSEVNADGSPTSDGAELIEIFNPTAAAIDLTHYYLSDSQQYWQLAAGPDVSTTSDTIAKFPDGASIGPNNALVIALDGADYQTAAPAGFGQKADFAIANPDGAAAMIVVAGGSAPTITNGGEMVSLFFWDGKSDLVKDVDLVITGANPSGANGLRKKTATDTVDGPDPGTEASAYIDDAGGIEPFSASAGDGKSYQRIAVESTGGEAGSGGNGIGGHDETTEDTSATWTTAAPTPGQTAL